MRVNDLVRFIKERERVRLNKEAGKPRPWTKDPILDKYRFCNIRREDDRVTQWLRENWYAQRRISDTPDVWFSAVVARLFNQPDALEALLSIECVVPFKPERVRKILHARKEKGLRNFNAAYIVSTNGIAMEKVDYVIDRVLNPLWAARKGLRPQTGQPLYEYQDLLTQFDGLGSFIGAQVVADLKYMPPLDKAPDWWEFARPGPGSKRGLNRVMGYPVEASWKPIIWEATLLNLLEAANKQLPEELHAQDLQNCLCEFDKYERARLGEGTPKQLYKERV